jgi:uncharacterized membrane protein YcgQ (UPF0703/DUF1980 family)
MIGQFMPTRANNAEGDRFNLVRMFVICCAADTRPVAITVQTEKGLARSREELVKVIGRSPFPSKANEEFRSFLRKV